MDSGRELDVLVQKALGITWDETRCRICGWTLKAPFCITGSCSLRPAPDRRADAPLNYSTDIARAWMVVEYVVSNLIRPDPYQRVRWAGPLYKNTAQYLTTEGYPLGTECWYVQVEKAGFREWVCAETAPLAICRAFIRLMEMEV